MVDSLKSLDDIDKVSVTVSDGNKTLYVKYETYRSLDFKFIWSNDHFIGYSITKIRGKKSRAVLAIWSPMEAAQFVTAYSLLLGLRAGRK